MKFKIILVMLFLLIVVECNNGKIESQVKSNKFIYEDMCIKRIHNSKEVCFGMDRIDAEKILGVVQDEGTLAVEYDHEVLIGYKDEKVALFI
ncbi:hypothetical protein VQL36_08785 [Chengkuizengella sp. SCS-71B]|uniref:hypothetical protein n=1 Tax=Chengkuizengella sp. SCS-71B TaxID=3115290 RepID=UPI0032C23C8C